MRTDLAVIDHTVDKALTALTENIIHTPDQKVAAAKAARTIVAGFQVHDDEAEKTYLDNLIAGKRKAVETFRADRKKVRDELSVLGLTPLAVVPTVAWEAICIQAGLFLLAPDARGQVKLNRNGFIPVTDRLNTQAKREAAILDWVKHNYVGFLKAMLPGQREPVHQSMIATLVLPQPPEDVAKTLLKARKRNLKVAAVAEAISFAETPVQLYRAEIARQDAERAMLEAIRRDPIIYTEEGTASAIIAQFGDFPIEQEVVEFVINSDNLISEKPTLAEVTTGGASTMSELYRQQMQARNQMLQGQLSQQYGYQTYVGGGVTSAGNATTTLGGYAGINNQTATTAWNTLQQTPWTS